MASMARRFAWAGPRSARSRPKTATHCRLASSTDSATRWATLLCRPRVIATYAAAAPVVSPIAMSAWSMVSPCAPRAVAAEILESGGRVVAGAHAQGQGGVVGVGEPVHLLQRHDRGGVGPDEGVVQD